jgi:hypothetical protein
MELWVDTNIPEKYTASIFILKVDDGGRMFL